MPNTFTKAPVAVTQYHYEIHQWYNVGTSDYYIPFGSSAVETSATTSTYYDDTFWIVPFSGKLIKAYMMFDSAPGVCDFKIRQGTNGTGGSLRASLMSGGTVNCTHAGRKFTFTCDQNNTVSDGDVINLFLDITAKTDQGLATTIWEID
jgi:hypothetical protein